MDIVEFLRARLDEDEAAAKTARGDEDRLLHGFEVREDWGRWALLDRYGSLDVVDEDGNQVTFDQEGLGDSVASPAIGEHIARHDPARVLREVEAKRQIVDLGWHHLGDEGYGWGMEEAKRQILAIMALPYADHPDYDSEWSKG